ncbi:MAG: polysaccharide deacetylase family protein [Nanoarchaeota archaeon]
MQRRDFLKLLGAGFAYSLMPSILKADEGEGNEGRMEEPEEGSEETECVKVPVLMYHAVNNKDSIYSRAPARFRRDLEYLYENGYKLTSIEELVNGTIHADKPVVLTLDDARGSQFRVDDENNINSDCAVGIIEDFCSSHPEFGKTAMFYVSFSSNAAFGQRSSVGYKLNWLLDNGYEVGNHTMRHTNMASCSLEEFKDTISDCKDEFEKYLGERASLVKSFCFPYCAVPSDEAKWEFLRGQFTSATIGGGRSYCDGDLYRIPRLGIEKTTSIERIMRL